MGKSIVSRFQAVVSATAVLLLSACGGTGGDRDSSQNGRPSISNDRLNLILIVMDTCRSDRTSPYGVSADWTPGLQRLADESVVFRDCLAQSSATGPSHRSLFTGQYVHRHKNYENQQGGMFSPYMLATLLQDAGWHTGAFIGGGPIRPAFGFSPGFDVFRQRGKPLMIRNKGTLSRSTELGMEWLEEFDSEEPFFMFVHGYDPHCPYWPPEPHRSKFAGWYEGTFPAPALCGKRDFEEIMEGDGLKEEEIRYIADLYQGGIASGDAAIDTFLTALDQRGLLDQSIVVFTSDHGESLGEHNFIGHTLMWEEQLQVPLLIRFPDGEWTQSLSYPTQHVDVLPTVLNAMGIAVPEGSQGRNLMPMIRGEESADVTERMRLAKFAGRETVRFDNRWKIMFRKSKGELKDHEIYDRVEDPGELNNLYGTEEGRRKFHEIYDRYWKWRESTLQEDEKYIPEIRDAGMTVEDQRALSDLGYASDGDEDEE